MQPTIDYRVNLFTMPRMQRVVYVKSLLQPVVAYCLLLSEHIWRHRVRCDWLKGLFGYNGVLSIGNICRGAASLQKALRDGNFVAQCMLYSLQNYTV